MRLAIFGGTGTVGRAVLAQALEAGHEVRALARTPAKVGRTDPRLRVIAGNANDLPAVAETLTDCDAVLTSLGGTRDPESISQGTANIMAAMRPAGIRRLVVMQGFHLTFPGDPNNMGRKLILPLLKVASGTLIGHTRAMAAAVRASELEWTVVRAPRVVVGGRSGSYRTGILRLGPWSSVTNADVADFMLACLDRGTFVGKAPMVAN